MGSLLTMTYTCFTSVSWSSHRHWSWMVIETYKSQWGNFLETVAYFPLYIAPLFDFWCQRDIWCWLWATSLIFNTFLGRLCTLLTWFLMFIYLFSTSWTWGGYCCRSLKRSRFCNYCNVMLRIAITSDMVMYCSFSTCPDRDASVCGSFTTW